jgi:hypothetical protein
VHNSGSFGISRLRFEGPAVSRQTKDKASLTSWKAAIRAAASQIRSRRHGATIRRGRMASDP